VGTSLCVSKNQVVGLGSPLPVSVPPVLVGCLPVRCRLALRSRASSFLWLLEFVVSFVFHFFGGLGLVFIGLAVLGALFMFPPLDCLLLLVSGGLISFVSVLALDL